jgi:hypothetical protein
MVDTENTKLHRRVKEVAIENLDELLTELDLLDIVDIDWFDDEAKGVEVLANLYDYQEEKTRRYEIADVEVVDGTLRIILGVEIVGS